MSDEQTCLSITESLVELIKKWREKDNSFIIYYKDQTKIDDIEEEVW